MPQLGWVLLGMTVAAALAIAWRRFGRAAGTRTAVLEEVRRTLRDGTLERADGRSMVHGRLGALEVRVDVQSDGRRPRQSPMWRVIGEGPIRLERPVEARVGGWEGWIDPWLQLGETLTVPAGAGPEFTLHAELMPLADHPVVTVLRRQAERLGPGAIHVRSDLVRVETRCGPRLEDNRALFAFLHAIGEIAELPRMASPAPAGRIGPRYGVRPEGR